ncbi:MAG: DinB family protein [Candidatus Dormibacteria bacterium]
MVRNSLRPDEIQGLLAGNPAAIAAEARGLTPAEAEAAPRAGQWSLVQVLAHLRSCADVWGGAMAAIAEGERGPLRAVNPLTWVERTNYRVLPFDISLQAYTEQRRALLPLLHRLTPMEWERTVVVTGAGRPLQRSALLYGRWLAGHERSHRRQVAATAAAVRRGRAGG